jgi:UDP-N-acetylmuramoyl-tripeptide--D-alanyl-D-alanine ligase
MDPLSLAELAQAAGGQLVDAPPLALCTRITTDSRTVLPGDVFWALKGDRHDGHEFAGEALRAGAQLVVCAAARADDLSGPKLVVDDTLAAFGRLARWYRHRQEALVIGVTGSVGKTSTKELIAAVLSRQFTGIRSPGNFNNEIGVPKSLLAIERHHEFAVLEMGAARVGDIRALAELASPEVGVITAIGKAHVASFGSVAGIVQAKGELLEALPRSGFAVLPGDDPVVRAMARRAPCRVVFVGEQPGSDVCAQQVVYNGRDLSFQVDGARYVLPQSGRHMLSNALLAVAVARELGVPEETIAAGLLDFTPAPGRGQALRCGPWLVIDDTYNASPTSAAAAGRHLASIQGPPRCKRYLVLGDMLELGALSADEHFHIGRLLGELRLDGVLAYGEFANDVARGAAAGGLRPGRLVATRDMQVLQAVLECWLEPGDIVLVKGSRGMHMERMVDWLFQAARQHGNPAPRRCA